MPAVRGMSMSTWMKTKEKRDTDHFCDAQKLRRHTGHHQVVHSTGTPTGWDSCLTDHSQICLEFMGSVVKRETTNGEAVSVVKNVRDPMLQNEERKGIRTGQ